MSMKAQVIKAVNMAFKAAGDLVTSASLFRVTSSSFNFNSALVSTPLPAGVPVSLLDVTTKKTAKLANEESKVFLMKTSELYSPTSLDYIMIGNVKWRIREVSLSDGYTSSVVVVKEGP